MGRARPPSTPEPKRAWMPTVQLPGKAAAREGSVEVALTGWGVSEAMQLPLAALKQEEASRQVNKPMCQQETGDPSPGKQTLRSSWPTELVRGSAEGWNGSREAELGSHTPGAQSQSKARPVWTVGKEKFPLSCTSCGTEALELTQHRHKTGGHTHKHLWGIPQTEHLPVENNSIPKERKIKSCLNCAMTTNGCYHLYSSFNSQVWLIETTNRRAKKTLINQDCFLDLSSLLQWVRAMK